MSKEQADLLIALVTLAVVTTGIILAMRRVSPSPEHSRQVLQRWGVPAPTEEQGELAAAYFRHRQGWYPPLFLGTGVICYFAIGADPFLILLVTVLAGLLIGELGAVLHPVVRSRRSAVLVRRRVTDLVPRFALVLYGSVTVVTFVSLVINVLWLGWSDDPYDRARYVWAMVAGFVLFVPAVAFVVWLSLVRGQVLDDGVVDAALRIRSARVAVGVGNLLVSGIGFVMLMGMDADPGTPAWMYAADGIGMWLGLVVVAIAVVNWVALLNPSRTSKLIEVNRR